MNYIDTHLHLDQKEFADDRGDVLRRARQAGVVAVVCVGISADTSRAALSIADSYEGTYAAVGIQPNCCAEAADGDWEHIVEMAGRGNVVALGETGLDRYWDYAPIDLQKDYFDRHVHLSQKCDLPLIIHCREAEQDLMPMLRAAAGRGPLRGVLHAFSGNAAMAAACVELGLYVSFAGMVTYRNKKFAPLWDVARTIPDDRLLIETDSPYLVPHPLRGKQKRNEPANVALVAARLAELRDVPIEQMAAQTTANARRLFRLP